MIQLIMFPCSLSPSILKEKFGFLHIRLIIRIFVIIYDVLQHHYDELRCSPESWSSLLTSLLAENNGGAKTQSTPDLKDEKVAECVVVSSRVPTRKHEAKQQHITQKQLFVCSIGKQLKEQLLSHISMFNFVFWCRYMRGHQETFGGFHVF